jgi:hypothetical protein
VNDINPIDYIDAARVAGVVLMALGAGLLILVGTLTFRRKSECNCDD